MYDNAVLADTQLLGSLAATPDTLKITITPLSMEERTRVWYAVQRTYRLSSAYEVRVVNLDSRRRTIRPPVREYRRSIGQRRPLDRP
jgi:Pvc16 N-terminal domain